MSPSPTAGFAPGFRPVAGCAEGLEVGVCVAAAVGKPQDVVDDRGRRSALAAAVVIAFEDTLPLKVPAVTAPSSTPGVSLSSERGLAARAA